MVMSRLQGHISYVAPNSLQQPDVYLITQQLQGFPFLTLDVVSLLLFIFNKTGREMLMSEFSWCLTRTSCFTNWLQRMSTI